jgi:2,4-dienoyl-CoA reductase-like NADH-dependent reductase (Old Yellow Enzyme family)
MARMRIRGMAKILTTINLGRLQLLHRVVVLALPEIGPTSPTVARRATRGGLVLQPFGTRLASEGMSRADEPPGARDWRGLNAEVRAHGGFTVAQLCCGMAAADPSEACVAACYDTAAQALAMQFDGVELELPDTLQSTAPLQEMVQAVIDVWGADRVGVQLTPFAWVSGPDDQHAVGPYCELLTDLGDMEIGYVHVAGAVVPGRGDLLASPVGRHLRAAYPGLVIASGGFSPATAIAAVERRWADMVGLPLFTGDGEELLAAIEEATR